MRERFGCCACHGGEGWVLPREINWKHWHHCRYGCDLLPTMQRGPEWAYVGRSQGPSQGCAETQDIKSRQFWRESARLQNDLVSVFFQFVLNLKQEKQRSLFPIVSNGRLFSPCLHSTYRTRPTSTRRPQSCSTGVEIPGPSSDLSSKASWDV